MPRENRSTNGRTTNRNRPEPDHPSGQAAATLDEATRSLIEMLQSDGRASYATLAKRVGLSETAVRQRVQRLRDEGVIEVVAVSDPMKLGFLRQVMIGIRTDGNLRRTADHLADHPEISYVVITAGAFDLLVEVVARDDEHLLELVDDVIRRVPGVRSTEMLMYLSLVKQSYTWGVA